MAQEYLAGETLHGLAKRHEINRNLVRIWVAKYEAGSFDSDVVAADIVQDPGGAHRRAGAAGRQAGARERVFKGGLARRIAAEKRDYVRHRRPRGLSVAEGCRLMGLARSTYYDEPQGQPIEEARLVERIKEICAEWPSYGYRRVTAELHAEGILVNHKKVMRLMREHGLTVRPRRRFVATTDSDHDGPIFPNLAKDVVPTVPTSSGSPTSPTSPLRPASSIWPAILDAWSRRVVGYAIGRRIDARLALAALKAAIAAAPPPGVHPSLRSRLARRIQAVVATP